MMARPRFSSVAVAVCACAVCTSAYGQAPPESPDQPSSSAPISPVDLPPIESVGSSQLEPPAAAQSRTITPAQEAAIIKASGRFRAPLISEGGLLVRASGTLGRDEFLGVWTFDLSDRIEGAQGRSLILLPAEPLADLITQHTAATRDGSTGPLFEVSGRVLVWKGVNYLLPTFAVPVDRRIARVAPTPFVPPGAQRSENSVLVESVVAIAPTAAPVPPASVASVDPETFSRELEARLNARITDVPSSGDPSLPAEAAPAGVEQPSLSTVSASDPATLEMPAIEARTHAPSISVAAPGGAPLLPPMRIQSRRGTLTRDPVCGTWRFVLASGVSDEGDLALELLPCSTLSSLVSAHRSRAERTSVLLTGDVTVFEGRNYLRPVRYQQLAAGKWIGP